MKLTDEYIASCIVKDESFKVGAKTTLVVLTLRNGFEVVGTSACVDPAAYDQKIGEHYARERALAKLWELEGYMLQNIDSVQMNALGEVKTCCSSDCTEKEARHEAIAIERDEASFDPSAA